MEVVGVVLVFFFAGLGLDNWLDTAPWFTLGLTVFGIIGTFVRAYYAYSAEMDRHQRERQQSRTVGAPAAPVQADAQSVMSPQGGEAE